MPIAANPISRNTGQVLGVFGAAELRDPERRFSATVRFRDIHAIETWLRALDTERLGFRSEEAPGRFRSDTALPGNRNIGHAFPATPLTPPQRLAVIEYLKDPLRFVMP